MKLREGFTFIETIVVLGVLAIALPTLFSVLFLVLQQQARILQTQDVKRQGDSIYNTLTQQIRSNGSGVYQAISGAAVCTVVSPNYSSANGANFYFQTPSGDWFGFERNNNNMLYRRQIALQPPTVAQLNSSTVQITAFTISCERGSQFSSPLVSFNFTISSKSNSKIDFNYQTKIKLRN